MVSGFKTIFR